MSTKHYVALAALFKKFHDASGVPGMVNAMAREAAEIFAADNPRFDRTKFLVACGVPS